MPDDCKYRGAWEATKSTKTSSDDVCSRDRSELDQLWHLRGRTKRTRMMSTLHLEVEAHQLTTEQLWFQRLYINGFLFGTFYSQTSNFIFSTVPVFWNVSQKLGWPMDLRPAVREAHLWVLSSTQSSIEPCTSPVLGIRNTIFSEAKCVSHWVTEPSYASFTQKSSLLPGSKAQTYLN